MYFSKVIDLDPSDATAWNSKGLILQRLERNNEANAAYVKARELGYTA